MTHCVDELRAEVERLRQWKAQATEIILDLQDLGKALHLPLGASITGTAATEAVKRLTARAEAAEAEAQELRERLGRVQVAEPDAE